MGKLIILTLIILAAFWIGRWSAGVKRNIKSQNNLSDDREIIDIEIED